MKGPSVIPVSLFLQILFFSYQALGSSCNIQFIEETCNKSSQSSRNLRYEFCVAALEAVPESCNADLNVLGIISSMLALHKASCIKQLILETTAQASDPYAIQALGQCQEVYSDAISSLEDSIDAFTLSRYRDANIYISGSMTESATCEGGFMDLHVAFPFAKETDDFMQLCSIALAITKLASDSLFHSLSAF